MKIGITGISAERKWGDEYYQKTKSLGFLYHDFNMSNTSTPLYSDIEDESEKLIRKEKRLADKAGATIWQVHGPWRWPPADDTAEARAERFEKMARSIRAARLLGAKYWVIHPIMPFGIDDIKQNKSAQTKELNIEFMRQLLEVAKREEVTVCLENMPFKKFSISSPAAIIEIVEEIGDPAFAMCLDTGHANVNAEWDSPAEAIRKYGKYIKALHIHDNRGNNDDHLAPFEGTIDWEDFSSALKETDFNGVISLECEPPSSLPEDIYEDLFGIYARIANTITDRKY